MSQVPPIPVILRRAVFSAPCPVDKMLARIAAQRAGNVARTETAIVRNRFFTQSSRSQAGVTDKAKQAAEAVQDTAHHAAKGSDAPWLIGSLLVFVPLTIYITSPSDTKHEIAKKMPTNMRNFGLSREPDPVAEVAEEGDPEPQPSDASEDTGHAQSHAEFSEASEEGSDDTAQADSKRPFQGDEALKSSRNSAPEGKTLESLHTDDDHEVHSKHQSSKTAATLQPRAGKLNDAVQLAKDGHDHSPITGLAEHEKKHSERSGEAEKMPHSKDNNKGGSTGTDTKKEEGAQ